MARFNIADKADLLNIIHEYLFLIKGEPMWHTVAQFSLNILQLYISHCISLKTYQSCQPFTCYEPFKFYVLCVTLSLALITVESYIQCKNSLLLNALLFFL